MNKILWKVYLVYLPKVLVGFFLAMHSYSCTESFSILKLSLRVVIDRKAGKGKIYL